MCCSALLSSVALARKLSTSHSSSTAPHLLFSPHLYRKIIVQPSWSIDSRNALQWIHSETDGHPYLAEASVKRLESQNLSSLHIQRSADIRSQTAEIINQLYLPDGNGTNPPWSTVMAEVRVLNPIIKDTAEIKNRIRSLGVGSVMGVPGDMNLELLDYIKNVDGLNWSKSAFLYCLDMRREFLTGCASRKRERAQRCLCCRCVLQGQRLSWS
jgi:hypothetical protein